MDMNTEEIVQAFGLLIATGCALYLLGNYGAEGDFWNKAEKSAAIVVPSTGGGCLLLTAFCEFVIIRREMRREAEETGQLRQGESSSDDTLVEASLFLFYFGVLITTFQSAFCVASAVMIDKSFYTLSIASLPIVLLTYIVSVACQPRRRSPKDMWKLRLHFMSFAFIGEMNMAVYGIREGDFGRVIYHFARLAVFTLLFYY